MRMRKRKSDSGWRLTWGAVDSYSQGTSDLEEGERGTRRVRWAACEDEEGKDEEDQETEAEREEEEKGERDRARRRHVRNHQERRGAEESAGGARTEVNRGEAKKATEGSE